MKRKNARTYRHWSEADDARLMQLRRERVGWVEISLHLDRTVSACTTRHTFLCGSIKTGVPLASPDKGPIRSLSEIHDARLTPTARRREIERDQRVEAAKARAEAEWQSHGCITSSYFGDPPPGWSALDRKRKDQHA